MGTPRIDPVEKAQASPDVQAVYSEIERAFGMVPNLFKTYAHFPPLLRANWEKTKALMMGGQLPRELKEAVALAVSAANGCRYCVAAHSTALRMMGASQERIDALIHRHPSPEVSPKEQKVVEFAVKATRAPNDITDQETEGLGTLGFTDGQIVELLGVVELFTAYNKFLDTLAVEIDFPSD
jgi:uncharacterized peroxidase-related enzyme